MFCPECECEYVGWTSKCPVCRVPLVEALPLVPVNEAHGSATSVHSTLASLVSEHGGQVSIDMSTTEVGRKRTWGFPYSGYGRAWAARMQGTLGDLTVDLTTTEVGMDTKGGFPYLGYGLAWAQSMRGHIGDDEVTLSATKVVRQKRWSFPYHGYGYAWTQELAGECGPELKVQFLTAEVQKDRKSRFPYRGYGYAWAQAGVLTATLATT